jgi:hypothetical protein
MLKSGCAFLPTEDPVLLQNQVMVRSRRRQAAVAVVTALATGALTQVAEAQVAEPPGADVQDAMDTHTITALSFDLSAVPGAAPSGQAAVSPAWRTTFGSERRSAPARPVTGGLAGADIVLLHGIGDMKTVRQWFPAREWKLVVSRQLLISDDPLETWSRDGIAPVPTTGIAVRYQPGMRVTAQEHLLDLALSSGSSPPTVQPAGTAIRIQLASQIVWALSVHLPPACFGTSLPCPEGETVSRWWSAKKEEGLPVLTGGRFQDPLNSAVGPCAHQSLRVELGETGANVSGMRAKLEAATGCTATATLPRTPAPSLGR